MRNKSKPVFFAIMIILLVISFIALPLTGCSSPAGNDSSTGDNNSGDDNSGDEITAPFNYIITGTDPAFTAYRDGKPVGTPGQGIQDVIDFIKTDADGKDCAIQFGDGSVELDIGSTDYMNFDGSGSPGWGKITLSGKITSDLYSWDHGIVTFENGVSIDIEADIKGTSSAIRAIVIGTGVTVNIRAGTISAPGTDGIAISNNSGILNIGGNATVLATSVSAIHNFNGTVNISGGTVKATSGNAINNANTGTVNISGGTISATTGCAVSGFGPGKVTVSGPAQITSENITADQGTICIGDNGTDPKLEITDGTISNTADNGKAIYNDANGTGSITISGGTISATGTGGYAVYNNASNSGAVTKTGGTITGSTYGVSF